MQEILENMIKSLVEEKAQVEVTQEVVSDKEIKLNVKVASADMGRVIGKQGRVAKAIRTVMKAVSGKEHKKVTIDFVD